jgi:hypothetical protein
LPDSSLAGQEHGPDHSISGVPNGTKSFAITVWWHWVVFNIPASIQPLPVGASGSSTPKLGEALFFRHLQFDQVPHGDAPGTKEGQPETVAMTFAVVFDLDGVLVDSESGLGRCAARGRGAQRPALASRRDVGDDGDELTGVEPLPARPAQSVNAPAAEMDNDDRWR